jgi:hypothetical protein
MSHVATLTTMRRLHLTVIIQACQNGLNSRMVPDSKMNGCTLNHMKCKGKRNATVRYSNTLQPGVHAMIAGNYALVKGACVVTENTVRPKKLYVANKKYPVIRSIVQLVVYKWDTHD